MMRFEKSVGMHRPKPDYPVWEEPEWVRLDLGGAYSWRLACLAEAILSGQYPLSMFESRPDYDLIREAVGEADR